MLFAVYYNDLIFIFFFSREVLKQQSYHLPVCSNHIKSLKDDGDEENRRDK